MKLTLTPAQQRVCDLAVKGLTCAEVGELLFITEKAVRFHLIDIYKKENVRNRTELAVKILNQRHAAQLEGMRRKFNIPKEVSPSSIMNDVDLFLPKGTANAELKKKEDLPEAEKFLFGIDLEEML